MYIRFKPLSKWTFDKWMFVISILFMCEPFNKHMFRWQDRLVGGGRVSSTGGTSCSLMYWSTLTYSCLHKDRWVQGLEEGGYQVQEEWALPWCTRERQPTHIPLRTDGVFKGGGLGGLAPPGSVKSMVLSGRRLLSLPLQKKKMLSPPSRQIPDNAPESRGWETISFMQKYYSFQTYPSLKGLKA